MDQGLAELVVQGSSGIAQFCGGEAMALVGGGKVALLALQVTELKCDRSILVVKIEVGLLEPSEVGPIAIETLTQSSGTAPLQGFNGFLPVVLASRAS